MAEKVIIYFGPRKAFDRLVKRGTANDERVVSFLDSIRVYNARIKSSDLITHDLQLKAPERVDSCIVYADDFGSVLSHVLPSFATILENTFDIGTLYVQNPPRRALTSLLAAHDRDVVSIKHYRYKRLRKDDLRGVYDDLRNDVLGQEESKRVLISNLYRLSVLKNDRPSVLLFLGPSGVGKTETARCVARAAGGELTRVQFSMMQTTEAYEYLFGAEHSKASFARDLLARESNVVLVDEIDKVNPRLYNMFYQLFDEGRYVDTNYDVDMRNALFLLTSNFNDVRAARQALGSAMFSRISAVVEFGDLTKEEKAAIAIRHYNEIISLLDVDDRAVIESSNIRQWFSSHANEYGNMRTMKNKVEKAIFEKLSAPLFESGGAEKG